MPYVGLLIYYGTYCWFIFRPTIEPYVLKMITASEIRRYGVNVYAYIIIIIIIVVVIIIIIVY